MKLPWSKPVKNNTANSPAPATDNFFLTLVGNLADGVIVYDQNFTVNLLNPPAEKIIGIASSECVGKIIKPELVNDPKFKIITQIIFPTLAPVVAQISEGNAPETVDLSLENPELKLRIMTVKINSLSSSVFVKIIKDQTREENILTSKKEFLEVAAHQLRTPLSALSWAFETLNKELQSNPNLKTITDEGLTTTKKLLKTVNDLLNAARIEGGKFGYKIEPSDIIQLVKNVVEQAKIIASQSGTKLFFETGISSLVIPIDVERIGLAISNLIDNALKYTPEKGTISVTIGKQDDKFIKISISDSGIGIPAQDLGKIFTKFFRGSNVKQVETDGSGLGLFIVKNIVKNHGGDIFVSSEVDRGTTFTITLPVNPDFIPKKEVSFESE